MVLSLNSWQCFMVIRMLCEIRPLYNVFLKFSSTRRGRLSKGFKFHLLCLRETCDRNERKKKPSLLLKFLRFLLFLQLCKQFVILFWCNLGISNFKQPCKSWLHEHYIVSAKKLYRSPIENDYLPCLSKFVVNCFCYRTSESLHSLSLLRFYNLLIGKQLNN